MASKGLTEAWRGAEAAKPPDWRIMGLRCASTGLRPDQRSDVWVAEACGPHGECIEARSNSPHNALNTLALRLRELRGTPIG